MPLKVLLDTDIGSDIDDAVALSYLLKKSDCHLLGITTVTGDAVNRARLVKALCEAAGENIPIYPGIEKPLVIEQRQISAAQAERLAGTPATFPKGQAIDFMRTTIRQNPGEVTLLAVGPFTNIATLFESDPEIPHLLKELVIMGGKFSDYPTPWGPTEWNAIVDPHATAIVFSSGVPLRAYGLDVTWQLSMTPDQVARKFKGDGLLKIVLDWSRVWFQERELLHFHDPLAAAAIFNPGICKYKRGDVQVELQEAGFLGVTHFQSSQDGRIKAAESVNADRFFQEYFSVFSNHDSRSTGHML
jgi:purine nucleosidase